RPRPRRGVHHHHRLVCPGRDPVAPADAGPARLTPLEDWPPRAEARLPDMEPRDRRETLLPMGILNGIDFVEVVGEDQSTRPGHFLTAVDLPRPLATPPTIAGGETIAVVLVNPIDDARDWSMDGDHLVLTLTVPAPGDFSDYTLTIQSPKLD